MVLMNKHKQVENHWMSISDMMSALMIIFLFIAISFMIKVNEQKKDMDKIIRESKQVKIEIYEALNKEFRDDFSQWGAELDQKTLSVRFKEPDVLFKPNSSRIEEKFIVILDDFFPRYLKVLNNPKFRDSIQEVRIEGHTSSEWRGDLGTDVAYLENMRLSQERARSVLTYVFGLKLPEQRDWLIKHLTANGLSFSQRIENDGKENFEKSRRVEFRIRTNADEKMTQLEDKAK